MSIFTENETAEARIVATLMNSVATIQETKQFLRKTYQDLDRFEAKLRKDTARICGLDPEPPSNIVKFPKVELGDVA